MKSFVVQARATVLVVAVCTLLVLGMILNFAAPTSAWGGSPMAGVIWDTVQPNATGPKLAGIIWDNVGPSAPGLDSSGWG